MKQFNCLPPLPNNDQDDKSEGGYDMAVEDNGKEEGGDLREAEVPKVLEQMAKNARKTAATFDEIIRKYELLEYSKGGESNEEVSEDEDIPADRFKFQPDANGEYVRDGATKKWIVFFLAICSSML
ncbi:hypothetical protein V494_08414 [Pseudogymnoascus sp. VKM F-4513 (FW-928)]|nr:hypothetical protein V494_08414 [Pseudogymnoascus sp. VKM F-4513 (FW-928)]